MVKNLLFALLFYYFLSGCSVKQYPATYTDETGTYRQAHGNVYYRRGDRITHKGYREYKLKGWTRKDNPATYQGNQVVIK